MNRLACCGTFVCHGSQTVSRNSNFRRVVIRNDYNDGKEYIQNENENE